VTGRLCSRTNSHGTHQRDAGGLDAAAQPPYMSETQRQRGEASTRRSPGARESPYPRENYFSRASTTSTTRSASRSTTHATITTSGRSIAGRAKTSGSSRRSRKGRRRCLCPYALNESPDAEWALHDENGEVVLSDPSPSEYPPPASGFVTPERPTRPPGSRRRVSGGFNPDHGYLVFGGIPRDQCREEFLAFVEELLDAIEAEPLEGERDAALELAADLKSRGDRRIPISAS